MYCVVPSEIAVADAPRGIDRSVVRRVKSDMLVALVSSLDAAEYESSSIAERLGDADWLAPRAVAHDALVTWASDVGAVLPFPMWVMFNDDAGVLAMLAEREGELSRAMDRVRGAREFGVRVSADRRALAAAAGRVDSRLAEMERQAAGAPPGEAYLLRRKLEAERKLAVRDVAVRIADRTHSELAAVSRSAIARAAATSNEAGLLLDGAYLVPNQEYDGFRTMLTSLVEMFEPDGVRFEFTGPWPPYHFVRDS
ncbi:MAG: GvpL/GvpF family gas vesicle protein [Gemmatimonadaceae bacterium]